MMNRKTILVVEDEEDIRRIVVYNLKREQFEVREASTGEEGLVLAVQADLILLDLMLPNIDGFEVCRQLKRNPNTAQIPIIILSAKGEEADIVTGLELGAEDYITKPFSPKILMARVRAAFRRKTFLLSDDHTRSFGNMTIAVAKHVVTVDKKTIDLTVTEFKLLCFLSRRPGWVFTRDQILSGVHGDDCISTDRAVDVQIVGLRRKLGTAGDYIETLRGVGYRFRNSFDH